MRPTGAEMNLSFLPASLNKYCPCSLADHALPGPAHTNMHKHRPVYFLPVLHPHCCQITGSGTTSVLRRYYCQITSVLLPGGLLHSAFNLVGIAICPSHSWRCTLLARQIDVEMLMTCNLLKLSEPAHLFAREAECNNRCDLELFAGATPLQQNCSPNYHAGK